MTKRAGMTWRLLPSLWMALSVLIPVSAAANMIPNGDLETEALGAPAHWIRGRWGSNSTTFNYPVAGVNNSKAAQTTITAFASGDAKWAPEPVAVTAGAQYRYTDSYQSSLSSTIENEYLMDNGSYTYQTLAVLPPAASFTGSEVSFTVPAGAKTVSVFHYIEGVGNITIDNAVLELAGTVPPPPPPSGNLIPNPSLTAGGGGLPTAWRNNRYGANTASFSYPISAESGPGLSVTVSAYQNGDAKWYHTELPVTAGDFYEFSDRYRGTAASYLGIQFRKTDGTYIYPNLGTLAPESGWTTLSRRFSVPPGAVGMIIYHAAQGNGRLETSAFSLRRIANDPTKFAQGMLSIVFDDGDISAYEQTVAVLDPLGLKSTHYIVSNYLSDNYVGYIKPPELLDLQARGHEIGAHTRTHRDLTKLSGAELDSELAGSRADLQALGVTSVNTVAYPFGAYNQIVQDAAAAAGFIGARSTNDGQNLTNTDKFALERVPVNLDTTFSSVQAQVAKAQADRSWLVLVFHHVDDSGTKYSTTPNTFSQIANYIKQSGIKMVSMTQGIGLMQ